MLNLPATSIRRLALCKAGLLKPEWTGLPFRAKGAGRRARNAALQIIRRFGYLQLDTVSVAGARSQSIVLLSRLHGFAPKLAEQLLSPGQPLFEYWGHEASWIPIELYPFFRFRREAFVHHPWWGDLIGQHPGVCRDLIQRIRDEGPLRSADMEGSGGKGWWDLKLTKRVATALWSSGELAIRERVSFQRSFDLAERVIAPEIREVSVEQEDAVEALLLRALEGHGWAATSTLAQTWRLKNMRQQVARALERLTEKKLVEPCELVGSDGPRRKGWVSQADLELATRLERVRPRRDLGVLLSPFDPILWDRQRVALLFNFQQVLEIFKPAPQRLYGYYCLPVLAGENLVGRCDLKADKKSGRVNVLAMHHEEGLGQTQAAKKACQTAVNRYAEALELLPVY